MNGAVRIVRLPKVIELELAQGTLEVFRLDPAVDIDVPLDVAELPRSGHLLLVEADEKRIDQRRVAVFDRLTFEFRPVDRRRDAAQCPGREHGFTVRLVGGPRGRSHQRFHNPIGDFGVLALEGVHDEKG